jgi:hypothetical protein
MRFNIYIKMQEIEDNRCGELAVFGSDSQEFRAFLDGLAESKEILSVFKNWQDNPTIGDYEG